MPGTPAPFPATHRFGLWLSLVERCVRVAEVVGSNPTSPTDFPAVPGLFPAMPSEDPSPQTLQDFDPDKTLFFQRRRQRVSPLPLIVAGLLVAGSVALVIWALSHPSKPPAEEVTDAPYQTPAPPRAALPVGQPTVADALPANTPPAFDPSKPVRPALLPDAPGSEPTPANAPLNLDVTDPANAQAREDVLRRIDLMPGVSAANKDKLYASVDHARSMGRVLAIPFDKGETTVRPAEVERLRQQIASPAIRQMTDDPTVVFVVLGYADPKGSDKVNAEVSLNRARGVLDTLRDRCGLQNVMHAVGMGGSTMFSAQQADKNRVAEVWAVLP